MKNPDFVIFGENDEREKYKNCDNLNYKNIQKSFNKTF